MKRRRIWQGFVVAGTAWMLYAALALQAQDATQPNPALAVPPEAAPPSSVEAPSPSPNSAALPDLSQLDEGFKQSSIGKAQDEYRVRIAWRKLENAAANEPEVMAAKKAAETAPTDLEKRRRLRGYYDLYYARMEARASTPEMRTALEQFKADHLRMLAQPRVRPEDAASLPTPTPTPKDKKKDKNSKLSKFRPGQ